MWCTWCASAVVLFITRDAIQLHVFLSSSIMGPKSVLLLRAWPALGGLVGQGAFL
jgi:hypothetical protein